MRKRIFAIWSVLLVLVVSIAVLVPGCGGGGGGQCTIEVKATLDGTAWTGAVPYILAGPASAIINGASVPATHNNVNAGSWSCGYVGGNPAGTGFVNVTPAGGQTVSAGGTITFTLNFVTRPPLDHFKFYEVVGGPHVDVVLPKVGDQFYTGVQEVEVGSLTYFGNPVAKTHDGVVTDIGDSDHHLTLYDITTPTIQYWVVEVDNQFGPQELTVTGPVMLAVPTLKEGHGPPMWLDHFLLYKVIDGEDVHVTVDLEDQWHKESDVEVYSPVYFANPAGKISPYVDWNPSDPLIIQNPDEHLVFYQIADEPYQGNVVIQNQFHQQETLSVSDPEFLAVPSEKISAEQVEQPLELDHFKCYWVEPESLEPIYEVVYLEDQFGAGEVVVEYAWSFCNPVEKTYDGDVTEIMNPDHHLTFYSIIYDGEPGYWQVEVNNQFGTQQLTVRGPTYLAVPTQKKGHDEPVGLDHFLLYEVTEGEDVQVTVDLEDQWHLESDVEVHRPVYFANPVQKTHDGHVTQIENPEAHLVFYEIEGEVLYPQVQVVNQFGEQTLYVYDLGPLAVPSVKLSFEPAGAGPLALDHFECYETGEEMFVGELVYLEDQFFSGQATVGEDWYFCNPVEKVYQGVVTPILDPDHHLMIYRIYPQQGMSYWSMQVNNQFGKPYLYVQGPVALAVPTQKMGHNEPVGLDHFLLYEVRIEVPEMSFFTIGLNDEFGNQEVTPYWRIYFANPVRKTDATGMVTEIQNPQAHLVFYALYPLPGGGQFYSYPPVQGVNQFGEWTFTQVEGPYLLAVPSEKISWQIWDGQTL